MCKLLRKELSIKEPLRLCVLHHQVNSSVTWKLFTHQMLVEKLLWTRHWEFRVGRRDAHMEFTFPGSEWPINTQINVFI